MPYQHMTSAIATVAKALGEAGAQLWQIVRTVVYILDKADADHVAHARGDIWPIASGKYALPVAALTSEQAQVEIEVTVVIHDRFACEVSAIGVRALVRDVTPDLASGLSPYSSPVRNGLVKRSWPMLEPAPWPQMKPTSSPSGSSLSLIDWIRVA